LGPRESVRHAARQNLSIRQSEKRVNLTPAPWPLFRNHLHSPMSCAQRDAPSKVLTKVNAESDRNKD
jgi:hypothetical protein